MHVTIEYCVPCGHLDRAIDVGRDLLTRYGRRLASVTLQTGEGGVFTISVDGRVVLDAAADGLNLTAVTDDIDQRLAA